MKKRYNRILSRDECSSLIGPAIEQASELRECSLLLYRNGHHQIAYSLYVLSIEELGKALLSSHGYCGLLEVKIKNILSHIDKIGMIGALSLDELLIEWPDHGKIWGDLEIIKEGMNPNHYPEKIKKGISDNVRLLFFENMYKKYGLYVDIGQDGELIIPSRIISSSDFPAWFQDDEFIPDLKKSISIMTDHFQDFFYSLSKQKDLLDDIIKHPDPPDDLFDLNQNEAVKIMAHKNVRQLVDIYKEIHNNDDFIPGLKEIDKEYHVKIMCILFQFGNNIPIPAEHFVSRYTPKPR